MEPEIKNSKAPLILGILSIFFFSSPIIGLPLSIIGIVVSYKKFKKHQCKAYKMGLGLNIAGLILTILFFCIVYYMLVNNLI